MPLVEQVFGPRMQELEFIWDQEWCTVSYPPDMHKPLLSKELGTSMGLISRIPMRPPTPTSDDLPSDSSGKKSPQDSGQGVPGTPGGTRPLSRGLPVNYTIEKTDRKGHFWSDTGRVFQAHLAIQEVFRKFM